MLRALAKDAPEDFQAAGVEAAEVIADEMRQRVPRRSGKLAGTIRTGASRRSPWVAVGSAGAPYVFPINFGWPARNIESQEFVYESIGATAEYSLKAYENALDRYFDVY